jgi:hypothetical protein
MKNLQIDIKIKIQINDATLELSKEEAELLYNTLGTALNKHAHPFFQPYTTPWTTIDGNNQLLYPPGVRYMTPTSTIT